MGTTIYTKMDIKCLLTVFILMAIVPISVNAISYGNITVYIKDQNGDNVVDNSRLVGNLTVELWYEGTKETEKVFEKGKDTTVFKDLNHTGLYTVIAYYTEEIEIWQDTFSFSYSPFFSHYCTSVGCTYECPNGESTTHGDIDNLYGWNPITVDNNFTIKHGRDLYYSCKKRGDNSYSKLYTIKSVGISQTYVKKGENDIVRVTLLQDKGLLFEIAKESARADVEGFLTDKTRSKSFEEQLKKAAIFEGADQALQTVVEGSKQAQVSSTIVFSTLDALSNSNELLTMRGVAKYTTDITSGVIMVYFLPSGPSGLMVSIPVFVGKEIFWYGFDENKRCSYTETDDLDAILPPKNATNWVPMAMINHADPLYEVHVEGPCIEPFGDNFCPVPGCNKPVLEKTDADCSFEWKYTDPPEWGGLFYETITLRGDRRCSHGSNLYNFMITSPSITNVQYPAIVYPETPLKISAVIRDDRGINSAFVEFPKYSAWPMDCIQSQYKYECSKTIDVSSYSGNPLEFRINAVDTEYKTTVDDNDQRNYRIQVVQDANSGRDAGYNGSSANIVAVNPDGSELTGYLVQDINIYDIVDTYSFTAGKGQYIDMTFRSDKAASLSAMLANGTAVRNLITLKSENNTPDFRTSIADISGTVYIMVVGESSPVSQHDLTTYKFSVSIYGTPWIDPKADGLELSRDDNSSSRVISPQYNRTVEIVNINGQNVTIGIANITQLYAKPNQTYTYKNYIVIDKAIFNYNPNWPYSTSIPYSCVIPDSSKGTAECSAAFNPLLGCTEESGRWICGYKDPWTNEYVTSLYIPANSISNGNEYGVFIGKYDGVKWLPISPVINISINNVDFPPKNVSVSSSVNYNSVMINVTAGDDTPRYADIYLNDTKIINNANISSGSYNVDIWKNIPEKTDGRSYEIYAFVEDKAGNEVPGKRIQTRIKVDSNSPVIGQYLNANPTTLGMSSNNKIGTGGEYIHGTVRLGLSVSDNESGIYRIILTANGSCSRIYPAGNGSIDGGFYTEGIPKVFGESEEVDPTTGLGQSSLGEGNGTSCNIDLTNESGSIYWNTGNLNGEQNITYTVRDRAGNEAKRTFKVNIDNTPPSIYKVDTGISPIRDSTILNVTASDSGSGIGSVEWFINDNGRKKIGPYKTTLWGTTGLNGTYQLMVKVTDNVGNSINLTGSVNILNSADLWPYLIEVSNATEGQSITINATIFNLGYRSVDTFKVDFRVDNVVKDIRTISLQPMQNSTLQFSWTAIQGNHEIQVIVDPDNVIKEGYDGDNIESFWINVSSASSCNPPSTGNWTVNQFTRCWYQGISVQIGKSLLLYNNLSLENTNLTTSRIVFRNASKITLKNSKIILKPA